MPSPSPASVFDAINSFQRTAAMRAAIELDLFTWIGDGGATVTQIAGRCKIAVRGARILCDQMVIYGFLDKNADRYMQTPTGATFLSRASPAYMGGALKFLLSPTLLASFDRLTDAVRQGGTAVDPHGTLAPEHDVWVDFARAMAPMMMMPAQEMAEVVLAAKPGPIDVLDIAAGHGLYGLAFAQQNPAARVAALDWANVLAVATENASRLGLADRFSTIPGSAFDVPLGGPYDVILLPNFLHHFDAPTCVTLLKRLRPALKPGGVIATMEFIPNDDRITPPGAATFALIMLATTPAGDAYTFLEYERMFADAGYTASTLHRVEGAPYAIVVTTA